MPRVPIYEAQVGTSPMPTPMQRPAPSPLVGAADALQQAGSFLVDIAEREERQARAVELADFDTFAEEEWTRVFHDDETGFSRLKGKEAFGGEQALMEGYEQVLRKRIEQMGSQRTQQVAELRLREILADKRRKVENFLGKQREVAKSASLVARKATGLDAVARNYNDPEAIAETLASVFAAIDDLAPSDEAAAAEKAEYQKEADAIVIQRFLDDKDTESARAYFAQAKDRLGKDATRIKRAIDVVENEQRAEMEARRIVERVTDDEGRVDASAALARVDEISDVQLHDEVLDRVQERIRAADALWNKKVSDFVNTALTQYESAGLSLRAIDPRVKDWLIRNAPHEWQRIRLMARAEADYWRRRREEGGPADTEGYARFVLDLANNPEKYRSMPFEDFRREWRTQMSEGLFKQAADRLAQHQQDKPAAIAERKALFKSVIQAAGVRKKDAERLQVEFDNWVQSEIANRNGKAPPHSEMKQWLEERAEMVVEEDWIFDNDRPRGLVKIEDIVVRTPADIPALDRRRLIEEYRAFTGDPNAMPTEEQLLRAFQLEQERAREQEDS